MTSRGLEPVIPAPWKKAEARVWPQELLGISLGQAWAAWALKRGATGQLRTDAHVSPVDPLPALESRPIMESF